MNVTTCPCCSEPVRLPSSDLPAGAQAKCPWCGETFSAALVEQQLPPAVELFDAAGHPLQILEGAMALGVSGGHEALGEIQGGAVVGGYDATGKTDSWDEATIEMSDQAALDHEGTESAQYDRADEASLSVEESDSGFKTVLSETWADDDEASRPTDGFEATEAIGLDETGDTDHEPIVDEATFGDAATEIQLEDDDSADEFQIPASMDQTRPSIGPTIDGSFSSMQVQGRIRKKSKRSPLRTLLGIALGPILALPIAGLIFYLLGTDLGFWPLDGGRGDGGEMRAAQPMTFGENHFGAPSDSVAHSDLGDPESARDMRPLLPPAEDQTTVASTEGSATDSPGGSDFQSSFGTANDIEVDVAARKAKPDSGLPARNTDRRKKDQVVQGRAESPLLSNKNPVAPAAAELSSDDAGNVPKKNIETQGAQKAKTAETTDLVLAVEDARTQLNELNEIQRSSPDWRRSLAVTYAAIAKIGEFTGDEQNPSALRLLSDLKQADYLDDLAAAAPMWLEYTKRTTEGVLLIGRPGSSESGPTIQLESGTPVQVKSSSALLQQGKQVIALGAIKEVGAHQLVQLSAVEQIE